MEQVWKLLAAALVGAAIALAGVSLGSDDGADSQASSELRVIAEGRFQGAILDMHQLYGERVEEELGIEIPPFEGPEPCVGIDDDELRELCSSAVAFDP